MEEKLRALGLNSYESRVFLTLCEKGPMDGRTLSKISGVPLGRIYDVLRELESRGAVYVQNSRPKIYAVPDAERAIENILRSRIEEFQKELSEVRSLAEELKEELKGKSKEGTLEAFWSFAMGIEKSLNIILQRLESVQNSLLNVATPQELHVFRSEKRKFTRVITSLLEREIELKILTTPEIVEILPPMHLRVPEVRVIEELPNKFAVLDNREALIKVENPARGGEMLGVIYMNDRRIAEELREHFMELWENAREI